MPVAVCFDNGAEGGGLDRFGDRSCVRLDGVEIYGNPGRAHGWRVLGA